jgi:hypothetical protein
VDPTAWKLEVERVGPRLRILLNADAKDWRSHLEEVQQHSKVGGASRQALTPRRCSLWVVLVPEDSGSSWFLKTISSNFTFLLRTSRR